MRGKLKGVLEAHMAQYRAIPKYYEDKSAKDDIVLAIHRSTIINTILALNKLNCETLTLDGGGDDFRGDNPLGTLSVNTEAEVLMSNTPIPTLKLEVTKPPPAREGRDDASPVPGCSKDSGGGASGSGMGNRLKRHASTAPSDVVAGGSGALKRAKEFLTNVVNVVRVEDDDGSDISDISDVDNTEDDDDDDDEDGGGGGSRRGGGASAVIHYNTVDSDMDVPDVDSDSESRSDSSASETV